MAEPCAVSAAAPSPPSCSRCPSQPPAAPQPTLFPSGRYSAADESASLSFVLQRLQITGLQVRMPLSCQNARTHVHSAPDARLRRRHRQAGHHVLAHLPAGRRGRRTSRSWSTTTRGSPRSTSRCSCAAASATSACTPAARPARETCDGRGRLRHPRRSRVGASRIPAPARCQPASPSMMLEPARAPSGARKSGIVRARPRGRRRSSTGHSAHARPDLVGVLAWRRLVDVLLVGAPAPAAPRRRGTLRRSRSASAWRANAWK